jgi:hypothetical protein
MEAVRSFETVETFTELHGVPYQKVVLFLRLAENTVLQKIGQFGPRKHEIKREWKIHTQ